ncbi:hypothetical protein Goklo_024055 [Gossypium klotzschianum]|uniref:Uncharacterized protein n=1 Tax=Gossypium klotzschianum TaxID=34286 RepID=A0A7J8WCR8_9ROSI|nr:hypothetical protein [Gossypium klotzschianum]
MAMLQNLQEDDIEWRAPWMLPDEILYRCGRWLQEEDLRDVNTWNQTRRMKRLAVGSTMTPEYIEWWGRRINDNIARPNQGDSQLTGKHLRVVPSDLEIIRQNFEKRNSELEKMIEQMEEEKMNLRLDMDWCQEIQEENIKADRWERKF